MAGKSKKAREKALEAEKMFKEAQAELEQAQKEEQATIENAKKMIDDYCDKNQLFCGTVFRLDDIATILKLLVEGNGIVKVPYNIYIDDVEKKEEEEKEVAEELKEKTNPYRQRLEESRKSKKDGTE